MLARPALRRRWRVLASASLLLALALPATASAADPLSAARWLHRLHAPATPRSRPTRTTARWPPAATSSFPPAATTASATTRRARYTATGTSAPTALYVGGTVRFGGGKVTVNGNQYARVVNSHRAQGRQERRHRRRSSPTTGTGVDRAQHRPGGDDDVRRARRTRSTSRTAFTSLRAERRHATRRTPTTSTRQERQRRHAGLDHRDGQPVRDAAPAARTSGASPPTSCAALGTITFRSMPSNATLRRSSSPTGRPGTWKAPNFSGIGITQADADPDRLPDRDRA